MQIASYTGDPEHELWQPAVNPWLIALAVILPTFMEVLDTTIANVALNHIAGSMSASYSQATWVLTSYLISNAVVLPLTAWLGNRFQRKRFLLFCIFLFTVSSLLCGLSVNLPMLLMMRVLQGIGGGALAPISQAILMESFPPCKQGIAQAVFGLGVVVAPVIGPVLGGWLTDSYSWRWIFYINIPFGLVAMWAIQQTVEDPPWVRDSKPGPLDSLGLVALSLWLGCQEVFLDKGQEDDWLSSRFIRVMAVLAVSGFVVFVFRELKAENPMVDLRLFRVRAFAVGTVLIFIMSLLTYSVGLLTPQFLQLLMGYSSIAAGIATSPLGLGAAVSMVVVGLAVRKIDARTILVVGFLLYAFAAYRLSTNSLWHQSLDGFLAADSGGSGNRFSFCSRQHDRDQASAPRSDRLGHRHHEPDAQRGRQCGYFVGQHHACAPQPGAADHVGRASDGGKRHVAPEPRRPERILFQPMRFASAMAWRRRLEPCIACSSNRPIFWPSEMCSRICVAASLGSILLVFLLRKSKDGRAG